MKLMTFRYGDRVGIGVLDATNGSVIPISDRLPEGWDMSDLVEHWDEVEGSLAIERGEALSIEDVVVLAPIPRPRRNIFCVGKNYLEHVKEFEKSGYDKTQDPATKDRAVFFTKATTTVRPPNSVIDDHSSLSTQIDYEVELAVIIGRTCRGATLENALNYVWGYTIVNDVTARDIQRDHQQWFLGKSLDGFCPMGPVAATKDEIDLADTAIMSNVNGELRQSSNTSMLMRGVPELIVTLSSALTLEPGDIIATGTPSGVGIGFDPPKFLQLGDTVSARVQGLGCLTNQYGGGPMREPTDILDGLRC